MPKGQSSDLRNSALLKTHNSVPKLLEIFNLPKMNGFVDTLATVSHLLDLPNLATRHAAATDRKPIYSIPTDIVETEKEYLFFLDVPGLSKSEVQVTVEDERTLVVKSNGKRKREDGEDEGCKYLKLERRGKENLLRKFRLPEDADVEKITARCENGVLKVVVAKNPPQEKVKTVEVKIA